MLWFSWPLKELWLLLISDNQLHLSGNECSYYKWSTSRRNEVSCVMCTVMFLVPAHVVHIQLKREVNKAWVGRHVNCKWKGTDLSWEWNMWMMKWLTWPCCSTQSKISENPHCILNVTQAKTFTCVLSKYLSAFGHKPELCRPFISLQPLPSFTGSKAAKRREIPDSVTDWVGIHSSHCPH